jgi:hypothetical protein
MKAGKLIIGSGLIALVVFSTAHASANARGAVARGGFAAGANGAGWAYAGRGSWGHNGGIGFVGKNAGAGIRGGQYKGANGGTFNTWGKFAYKRGIGGVRHAGWNGTAANGSSGHGYVNNVYNGKTGLGNRNSSEQLQTASGKDYGYNGSTTYSKGHGGDTQIDTDNHGDYNIDWAKGQKPVVTQTSASN